MSRGQSDSEISPEQLAKRQMWRANRARWMANKASNNGVSVRTRRRNKEDADEREVIAKKYEPLFSGNSEGGIRFVFQHEDKRMCTGYANSEERRKMYGEMGVKQDKVTRLWKVSSDCKDWNWIEIERFFYPALAGEIKTPYTFKAEAS